MKTPTLKIRVEGSHARLMLAEQRRWMRKTGHVIFRWPKVVVSRITNRFFSEASNGYDEEHSSRYRIEMIPMISGKELAAGIVRPEVLEGVRSAYKAFDKEPPYDLEYHQDKRRDKLSNYRRNFTYRGPGDKPMRNIQVETLVRMHERGHSGGIVKLPTGVGKTILALNYMLSVKHNTIFINEKVHLSGQSRRAADSMEMSAHSAHTGARPNWSERHLFCVDKTFQKWLRYYARMVKRGDPRGKVEEDIFGFFQHVETVFVDECHLIRGDAFVKCLQLLRDLNPRLTVFGLSATPYSRSSQGGFGDALKTMSIYGPVIAEQTFEQSVEDKYLSPMVALRLKWQDVQEHYTEEDPVMATNSLISNKPRNVLIRRVLEYLAEDGRTSMLMLQRVAHVDALAERLDIPKIHGAVNQKNRKDLFAQLSAQELHAIVGSEGTCAEGVDIPALSAIVYGAGKGNYKRTAQALGRCTRLHFSKKFGVFIDLADQLPLHYSQGAVTFEKASENRISVYKDLNVPIYEVAVTPANVKIKLAAMMKRIEADMKAKRKK